MDYQHLGVKHQLSGYISRQQQLEEEYFTNKLYLDEAELVGSDEEAKTFRFKMATLDARHNVLSDKIEELKRALEEESAREVIPEEDS